MSLVCGFTFFLLFALVVGERLHHVSHHRRSAHSKDDTRSAPDIRQIHTSNKQLTAEQFANDTGFSLVINDGTQAIFRPILPGVDVPSAKDFQTRQDAAPSPDNEEEEEEGVCFPADAYVELENGDKKRMDQVNVGDRVLVGTRLFSTVFMFTHNMPNVKSSFVKIETEHRATIRLTPGHYLYVNGRLTAAQTVVKGDLLTLHDGRLTTVTDVSNVFARGLFNPQTTHGDIVVDGILSSTYTRAVLPGTAHALLAPLRAFHDVFGLSTTCFDNGADYLIGIFPKGAQRV